MNIPLTRTKILVPRRPPNLLTRKRLLDLLYELLDYRLIIVSAPAGYGKTSLLVDLAHHSDMPICWYALDALDQDPQRFITHFIGAIAQRFPNFGRQSASALQNWPSPDLDVDQLVSVIVNEAYEQIREHFAIVLDDYHAIGENEAINHFTSQFIQKTDENCHLVLSSRTLLSLPDLPLMVARSQAGGLAFKELSFRPDEMQALLQQNYHLAIPVSEAEKLVEETEGWITGLLLSAQTMWQGMADRAHHARVSGVGLYDYLAQQVLDQQTAPIRDFLLRTSLMEEFDATLCEAVLGPGEEWRQMMEAILQSNLFVLPVDDGGIWLRYHLLFRDFLQARLAREQPEERSRILRRLIAVFSQQENWEKAYDICQRLGDVEVTVELIEEAGSSMIKSGRWATLARWIDALPAEVVSSRPALYSLRGDAAVMLGETAFGLSLLDQAAVALRKTGDRARLARTLVRRATARRFRGDYRASLADADEALALAKRDNRLETVYAEALREKGMNFYRVGRTNKAIEWLGWSLAAYRRSGDGQNEAMLLMELGLAHTLMGHYESALANYVRALEYWKRTESVAHQASLLNNLGVLHHLKGDYEAAVEHLEEAIGCARRTGYARMEAVALCSLGDLYSELDAPQAALNAYRQAFEIARHMDYHFVMLYLDLGRAALRRADGDLRQARALLESAERSAQGNRSMYEQGLCQLEAGRQALADDDAPQAVAHFEKATRYFQRGRQRAEAARGCLYLAVACELNGDEPAAFSHLGRAFRLSSSLESEHILVVACREAKNLLGAAVNDPALCGHASRMLRQLLQFEQEIPHLRRLIRRKAAVVPFGPPRLSFQALGAVEAMVGERKVTRADWQAQVARDLLFCLLAHPNGLTKEAIGAIFWPEHSPAQLKLQFKQTIYRLRRALGQNVVLLDHDRYRLNRAIDYEYDVDVFWSKLHQARATTEKGERATAYRAAVGLYEGPYLPDTDEMWVHSERERLWQAFVEAALWLAEFHHEAGENDLALDYCQRVLAQDPCQEGAHRLAMRIYAAMGNRAEVARQLQRCRLALSEQVNAGLSPQTQALYEVLTHR